MKNSKKSEFFAKYGMPIILAFLVAILVITNPSAHLLAWENVKMIMLQTAVLGFLALGLSLVMIAGESDISFAGTLGLMSATFSVLTNKGLGYFPTIAILIIMGIAISGFMAVLVIKGGFSGFIISIAIMFMGMGVERSYNEGVTIWIETEEILKIGRIQFAGFYAFTWVMLLAFAIVFIIIQKTKYGFDLRIIGENRNAGIEAGVKVDKVKAMAFIIAGGLYAIASSIDPIRNGGSIVCSGEAYMLPALAACYLGSTMFVPGHVNVIGTLIGALFMNIISNFMQLMNMKYYYTPLVQGLVLLISVGVSVYKNRKTIQQCLV